MAPCAIGAHRSRSANVHEQEATPPSERVGPRAKGSPRPAVNSSDTKYKLINTRRGRACGSRARAEGMDMIPR